MMGGEPHTQEPKSTSKEKWVAQDIPSTVFHLLQKEGRRRWRRWRQRAHWGIAFLNAKPGPKTDFMSLAPSCRVREQTGTSAHWRREESAFVNTSSFCYRSYRGCSVCCGKGSPEHEEPWRQQRGLESAVNWGLVLKLLYLFNAPYCILLKSWAGFGSGLSALADLVKDKGFCALRKKTPRLRDATLVGTMPTAHPNDRWCFKRTAAKKLSIAYCTCSSLRKHPSDWRKRRHWKYSDVLFCKAHMHILRTQKVNQGVECHNRSASDHHAAR